MNQELKSKSGLASKRGQAMTEYVIIAGMMTATFAMLTLFLTVFKEYGVRILEMVSSDYP